MHFKLKITCCQTCTDLMSAIVLQCTQSDLYLLSRHQHGCWRLLLLLRWNQTIWTRRTWGSRRGDMVKFHSIVHDDYELHSCRWRGGGSVNRFSYRQSDSHSVLQMTPLSAFDPNQTYVCVECCSIIARPCNDNAAPELTHLHLFVCVRYVVQEDMSCVSWASGRRISSVHNYGAERFAPNHQFKLCLDHLYSNIDLEIQEIQKYISHWPLTVTLWNISKWELPSFPWYSVKIKYYSRSSELYIVV